MKKLMTMIAAAAMSFGLFAEPVADSGTSFEVTSGGGALSDLIPLPDELTPGLGAWAIGEGAEATVVSYLDEKISPYSERSVKFPPTNEFFLKLKTSSAEVLRYAKGDSASYNVLDDMDARYYIDSVVQMTAFDDDSADAITDAKLAIWLREIEDDPETAGVNEAATNLMMKVGSAPAFRVGDGAALLGKWARVTVKALPIKADQIGFVLYIDKTAVNVGQVALAGLTPVAQAYADAGELIVVPTEAGTTIASLGFKGTGFADDIVFTQDMGDETFADDPAVCTVTWPTDGSVTAVTIGGEPVDNFEAGQQLIVFADPFENVVVAWTGDDTHKNGSYTITSSDETDVDIGDALEEAVAKIGDEKYETLAKAALDAANATIVLVDDVDESVTFAVENATLDLNGKILTGVAEASAAIYVDSGSLTITNSTGTGTVNKGEAEAAVDVNKGVVAIQAGTFVGGAFGDGSGTFTGGTFDNNPDETFDTAEGYEPVDNEDGTWTIQPITGYTITIDPAIVNGTVSTDPAGKVAAGTTVTVTATPATDYALDEITVEQKDGTPVKVESDGTFEMPAADVTVSATFEAIPYVVSVKWNEGANTEKFLTAAEAFAKIQALQKQDVPVLYFEATFMANDESVSGYKFYKDSVITIDGVKDPGFCTWDVVGSIDCSVGVENKKKVVVCGEGSVLTLAGLIKSGAQVTAADITVGDGGIALSPANEVSGEAASKILTKTNLDDDIVGIPEGYKVKKTPYINDQFYYELVKIEYAELTIDDSDAGVKTLTATNAEGTVFNTGAKFDKDLAVKLYACFTLSETGVELDADNSVLAVTMDADRTIKVVTKALISPEQQTKDANVIGLDELSDQASKDKANANFHALFEAFGSEPTFVATWTKAVYGDGGKIPAAKLAASNAELMAAAAEYNLAVMAEPVTVTPGATADGKFTFAIKDGEKDNPVVAATKAIELMKYTGDLTVEFDRTTSTVLTAAVVENLITVGFTGKDASGETANAGFMKVDLTVDKGE